MKSSPPIEIRKVLTYCPVTGLFTRTATGAPAGVFDRQGYVRIHACKRVWSAHRLAWWFVHGVWPAGEVDHINQIKNDNRISNLRVVSRSENRQNISAAYCTSTSGVRGVCWSETHKRWVVRLKEDKKIVYDKTFSILLDAVAARYNAVRQFHPFANTL